jgi:hypothetical protein
MSVVLGPGRAQIAGTSVSPPAGQAWTTQAMYTAYNDANLTLTVAASNPTNPRIDAQYIQVQDAFYSGSTNTAVAGIVTGTPAPSPTPPAIPSNSLLVAYIAVGANVTSIVSANITQVAALASLLPNAATNAQVALTGLTLIKPSFVGGTGAVLGANGKVTFTNSASASPIDIRGIFSAGFDNYRMVLTTVNSAGGVTVGMQLAAAGTANTPGYDLVAMGGQNGVVNSFSTLNAANWAPFAGLQGVWTAEIMGPFLTAQTMSQGVATVTPNPGTAPTMSVSTYGALHRASFSADGVLLTFTGGTGTGTVRFYGWNNG